MSAKEATSDYILLFRGIDWHKRLPPEEVQRISNQWMAWFKGLMDEGRAIAGSPLHREGRVISSGNGRTISDGPYAESKEAIGGYFLLRVSGVEEAVAIARECPGLPYGAVVEVRPVAEACPLIEGKEAAHSHAGLAHALA